MDKSRRGRDLGQTLVETAIVLPVLLLILFTGFQIVAACFNLVVLQTKIFQESRIVSIRSGSSSLLTGNALWGNATFPLVQRSRTVLRPWRPFKPVILPPMINTVQAPGSLVHLQLKSFLWPGTGITRLLPILKMQLTAETMLEPEPPPDR